jgi:hypothetical protein
MFLFSAASFQQFFDPGLGFLRPVEPEKKFRRATQLQPLGYLPAQITNRCSQALD